MRSDLLFTGNVWSEVFKNLSRAFNLYFMCGSGVQSNIKSWHCFIPQFLIQEDLLVEFSRRSSEDFWKDIGSKLKLLRTPCKGYGRSRMMVGRRIGLAKGTLWKGVDRFKISWKWSANTDITFCIR